MHPQISRINADFQMRNLSLSALWLSSSDLATEDTESTEQEEEQ